MMKKKKDSKSLLVVKESIFTKFISFLKNLFDSKKNNIQDVKEYNEYQSEIKKEKIVSSIANFKFNSDVEYYDYVYESVLSGDVKIEFLSVNEYFEVLKRINDNGKMRLFEDN